MEPDETGDERMARLLKAAGAATEFLAADLGKILERSSSSSSSSSNSNSNSVASGGEGAAPSVGSKKDPLAAENGQGQRNQAATPPKTAAQEEEEKKKGIFEKLRDVSVQAAEFSRLCSMSTNNVGGGIEGDGGDGDDGSGSSRNTAVLADDAAGAAVERAEALCGRIEGLLSAAADDSDGDNDRLQRPPASVERQHEHGGDVGVGVDSNKPGTDGSDEGGDTAAEGKSKGKGKGEGKGKNTNTWHIGGIVCPNGRQDLPARLAAARDALVPVIGERTSVGSLKVALLGLKSSVERETETRLKELYDRVSVLDKSMSGMKDSLRGTTGRHDRRSIDLDMDMDTGGGGGGTDGGGVTEDDLEERLSYKADVSWVQRELQRLWDALDARAMAAMAALGTQQMGVRPRSAPSSNNSRSNKENTPEMAGEEESDVTPSSRVISTSLPSAQTLLATGIGGSHVQRSSLNEGSSIIKDLLRKFSRLEQQVRCGEGFFFEVLRKNTTRASCLAHHPKAKKESAVENLKHEWRGEKNNNNVGRFAINVTAIVPYNHWSWYASRRLPVYDLIAQYK